MPNADRRVPDTRCKTLVGFTEVVWLDHGIWRGETPCPQDERRVVGEELAFLKLVLLEERK